MPLDSGAALKLLDELIEDTDRESSRKALDLTLMPDGVDRTVPTTQREGTQPVEDNPFFIGMNALLQPSSGINSAIENVILSMQGRADFNPIGKFLDAFGDPTTTKIKVMSEVLETAGVDELGSVDLPILGKVTGRGALGFLIDVFNPIDPLNKLRLFAKTGKGRMAEHEFALNAWKKYGRQITDKTIEGVAKRDVVRFVRETLKKGNEVPKVALSQQAREGHRALVQIYGVNALPFTEFNVKVFEAFSGLGKLAEKSPFIGKWLQEMPTRRLAGEVLRKHMTLMTGRKKENFVIWAEMMRRYRNGTAQEKEILLDTILEVPIDARNIMARGLSQGKSIPEIVDDMSKELGEEIKTIRDLKGLDNILGNHIPAARKDIDDMLLEELPGMNAGAFKDVTDVHPKMSVREYRAGTQQSSNEIHRVKDTLDNVSPEVADKWGLSRDEFEAKWLKEHPWETELAPNIEDAWRASVVAAKKSGFDVPAHTLDDVPEAAPWLFTRKEYTDRVLAGGRVAGEKEWFDGVKAALREGETVPTRVLRTSGDLRAIAKQEAARAFKKPKAPKRKVTTPTVLREAQLDLPAVMRNEAGQAEVVVRLGSKTGTGRTLVFDNDIEALLYSIGNRKTSGQLQALRKSALKELKAKYPDLNLKDIRKQAKGLVDRVNKIAQDGAPHSKVAIPAMTDKELGKFFPGFQKATAKELGRAKGLVTKRSDLIAKLDEVIAKKGTAKINHVVKTANDIEEAAMGRERLMLHIVGNSKDVAGRELKISEDFMSVEAAKTSFAASKAPLEEFGRVIDDDTALQDLVRHSLDEAGIGANSKLAKRVRNRIEKAKGDPEKISDILARELGTASKKSRTAQALLRDWEQVVDGAVLNPLNKAFIPKTAVKAARKVIRREEDLANVTLFENFYRTIDTSREHMVNEAGKDVWLLRGPGGGQIEMARLPLSKEFEELKTFIDVQMRTLATMEADLDLIDDIMEGYFARELAKETKEELHRFFLGVKGYGEWFKNSNHRSLGEMTSRQIQQAMREGNFSFGHVLTKQQKKKAMDIILKREPALGQWFELDEPIEALFKRVNRSAEVRTRAEYVLETVNTFAKRDANGKMIGVQIGKHTEEEIQRLLAENPGMSMVTIGGSIGTSRNTMIDGLTGRVIRQQDNTTLKLEGDPFKMRKAVKENLERQAPEQALVVVDPRTVAAVNNRAIRGSGLTPIRKRVAERRKGREITRKEARERGVQVVMVPTPIASALNETSAAFQSPQFLNRVARTYQWAMSLWKGYAVLAFGFHARNTVGNLVHYHLADANPVHLQSSMEFMWKARDEAFLSGTTQLGGRAVSNRDIVDWLHSFGIKGSGFAADTLKEAGQASLSMVGKSQSNKVINTLKNLNPADPNNFFMLRANRAVGTVVEDWSRVGLFIDGLDKGLLPQAAAQRVNKYLFDYSRDFGKFGRGVGQVMPFYKWSFNNVPFQVQELITNPHRMSHVAKAIEYTRDAEANKVPRPLVRKFIKEGLGIPTKVNKDGTIEFFTIKNFVSSADLSDVAKMAKGFFAGDPSQAIKSAGETLLRNMGGPLKAPIENIANHSFFTGQEVERFEGESAYYLADKVKIPGTDIEMNLDEVGIGGFIKRKNLNLLRQLRPINELDKLNPFNIFGKNRPGRLELTEVERFVQFFGGGRTYKVDPERGYKFFILNKNKRVRNLQALKKKKRRQANLDPDQLKKEFETLDSMIKAERLEIRQVRKLFVKFKKERKK